MYAWLNMVTRMRLSIFLSVGSCFKGQDTSLRGPSKWVTQCVMLFCQLVAVLPLLPVNPCSATAQVAPSTNHEIHKAEMWPILLKFVSGTCSHGTKFDVMSKKAAFECLCDWCDWHSSFPSSCDQKDPCQSCAIDSTKMEEERAFVHPKMTFFVWVTTAVMEPLAHVISLPWLLSPKREFMGQKIQECLCLCLSRLVPKCRTHGALGLFPVTPARTASISVSVECVLEIVSYWYTLLCTLLFFSCSFVLLVPERSHIVNGMIISWRAQTWDVEDSGECAYCGLSVKSSYCTSRAWLFLCHGEKTISSQLLTGILLSCVGEVQVYSTYSCVLQRQDCD